MSDDPTTTTTAAADPTPSTTAAATSSAPSVEAKIEIDPDDGSPQSPTSIQAPTNAKLTLTWNAINASSVNIDGIGDGQKPSGSAGIATADATFTLVAVADDGTLSPAVVIAVSTHEEGVVASGHSELSSGVAVVISFVAQDADGNTITHGTVGAKITLSAVVSESTNKVTIDGKPANITETADGHKQATLDVTLTDGSTDFTCEVSANGVDGDPGSVHLDIDPGSAGTTTTTQPVGFTTTQGPGTTTTQGPAAPAPAPSAPVPLAAQAPGDSTTAAATISAAPETTTASPTTTTTSDVTITAAPGTTTTQPPSSGTTAAPGSTTTHAPGSSTTSAPGSSTTHAPASTTSHAPTTLEIHFSAASGFCGDDVHVTGTTTLPDGTIQLTLTAQQGTSAKLVPISVNVAGGQFDEVWKIANVDFGPAATALSSVVVQASAEATVATTITPATITVNARNANIDEMAFDVNESWSGFTCHARFKQKQTGFTQVVTVNLPIMKAWGATYINLTGAGVTGTAGGCPWAGYRWARSASALDMTPNQYHNGTAWVAMPTGFVVNNTVFGTLAFYKSGTTWACPQGGSYPEAFADYDFNATANTSRRGEWITDTNTKWTGQFLLRRAGCTSDPSVNCCRYEVTVTVVYAVTDAYAADVVLVAPENMRSNAVLWFMGDSRISVAAHETGHIMDNPDEYVGGAVDTSLNGDGAVNGIDANSIMGQNLAGVKLRHYHAFAATAAKLLNGKYSTTETYPAVAKT